MKNNSKYFYFVLLAFGAILASNIDGSAKAIGIAFMAISVSKIPNLLTFSIGSKVNTNNTSSSNYATTISL